jgi:quaternary ammonium compound-resistance protein SugE
MTAASLAWIYLVLSGLADVVWAVATKYAQGYTRLGWTVVSILSLIVFVGLLTQALKVLPLGTAYAVWTGIGAVGSVLAGILLFGEDLSLARLTAILVIITGVVSLKLLPT